MLEHLGHPRSARALSAAVEEQLQSGARTPDLVAALGGPPSSTEQVGAELLARVEQRLG
jgi:isocitrate/isopropylmalate dehydrogenase